MTRQELMNELAGLQQKRLDLAAKLDKDTLQLQLWDKHIFLLQEMLVTLEAQGEQEERRVRVAAEEKEMKATAPIVQVTRATTSLGA